MTRRGNSGTFTIDMTPQMRSMLRNMLRDQPDVKEDVLLEAAGVMEGEAQDAAPYKSGDLKASHVSGLVEGSSGDDVQSFVGATVDYALVVHETHWRDKRWLTTTIRKRGAKVIRSLLTPRIRTMMREAAAKARRTGGSS